MRFSLVNELSSPHRSVFIYSKTTSPLSKTDPEGFKLNRNEFFPSWKEEREKKREKEKVVEFFERRDFRR